MPTLANRNTPAELEIACRVWPVAGLVSVMGALGTSAPVASATVPLMVALSWDHARGVSAASMARNAKHTVRYLRKILPDAGTLAMWPIWLVRFFMVCLLSERW